MNYLFTIQGEGRGHFTQALVMQEMLQRHGHRVVAFLVGSCKNREVPRYFQQKVDAPIVTFCTPDFTASIDNKRPNIFTTSLHNLVKLPDYVKSMSFIRKTIDSYKPDAVVNFFEICTGLTYGFTPPEAPLITIGHQYLFLHSQFEFPPHAQAKAAALRLVSQITSMRAKRRLALSFYPMEEDRRHGITVIPPLMRRDVREITSTQGGYIHGYLLNSGFVTEIEAWHKQHREVELGFFWDKKEAAPITQLNPNLTLYKIDDSLFLQRMAGCKAYATTAGFESVCEALYLQKPIIMVPVHLEQECNAFDAQKVGAGIARDRFDLDALLQSVNDYRPDPQFRAWVDSGESLLLPHLEEVARQSRAERNPASLKKSLLRGKKHAL